MKSLPALAAVASILLILSCHEQGHAAICLKYDGIPEVHYLDWKNATADSLPSPWTICTGISKNKYNSWKAENQAWDMHLEDDAYG